MTSVERVKLHYNNVYLVRRGGGMAAIDTGPDYAGARQELEAACGSTAPDIVVATHGHMDHASLGQWWQSRGVPVAMGAADLHYTRAPAAHVRAEVAAQEAYLRACGAPSHLVHELAALLARRSHWADIIDDPNGGYPPATRPARWPTHLRYEPFEPDQRIDADCDVAVGLRVWLSPGHTPGNLVLVDESEGWLFSGDQLLPDLTPVPAFQLAAGCDDERFRSLPAFVASLYRLARADFSRCFPAHGEPFDNVRETVEANLSAIEERTERVAAALRARPANAFALAEQIYPRAVRRRFWQIVPTVQGHLDLLEDEGRVRRWTDGYELLA